MWVEDRAEVHKVGLRHAEETNSPFEKSID